MPTPFRSCSSATPRNEDPTTLVKPEAASRSHSTATGAPAGMTTPPAAWMGAGVPMIEVLGTGAMLLAFVVIEMILLGRLFQASLLRTGQPPKLGGFIAMMFGKSEA